MINWLNSLSLPNFIIASLLLLALIYMLLRATGALRHINLWFQYLPTYYRIYDSPRLRGQLWNSPGMKYMKRGWRIIYILFFLVYITGVVK